MTHRSALAAPAILVALGAAPALAQVPGDTLTRRDTTVRLAPVEVSADRLPASAATAPYALVIRDADAIPRGMPALALDEALRNIPGVQIDNRFNFAQGERISIRAAGARAQFGVRGVRVLIDGIPATLPDGQTTLNQIDLTTISRIEVVRGPVASMFGNAAGGAILLETAAPSGTPAAGELAVTGGTHGLLRVRAAAGGASGAWRYSASGTRMTYGGFRTHSAAENVYGSVRASWLGSRDLVRVLVNVVDFDARNPGSLSDSLLRVDRNAAYANNVAQRTGESGTQRQGGVQWRRTMGRDEIEVTGWGITRDLHNPIPARVVEVDRLATGLRALHRGTRGPATWAAGVEHEVQRDDRQNYRNEGGESGALVLDQDERVSSLGAFAQSRVAIGSMAELLGGVRHDRVVFRADDHLVTDTDPDDSGRRTLTAVSPSFGATLLLPQGIVGYANVATAFETPTTTELANRPDGAGGFNLELDPQRTISYEVGARRLAGRASVQVALYRAFVRDALIPFEVADVPGRTFFRNAGRTEAAGVEAGVSVRPLRMLGIEAAYTHTSARFRESALGDTALAGNRLPGVAPHRLELTATLTRGTAWFATDVRHQSRMAADDANTAWSPAYTVTDVRAGSEALRVGAMAVAFTGGVQNVGATRYNASVVVNAFGRRYYEPGPARTFHVGATVSAATRPR